MKNYTYKCRRADTKTFDDTLEVIYDGRNLLRAHIAPRFTLAIVKRGDTVEIKRLEDGTVSVVVNKKSRPQNGNSESEKKNETR